MNTMNYFVQNAYTSLGNRSTLNVSENDLKSAEQALTGLLFARLYTRLGATTLASGKIKIDQEKFDLFAFAQSGKPDERSWWKQLYIEAVKSDYQFAPERLHQLIQHGPIRSDLAWTPGFKFIHAHRYLKPVETVEGWVYYDQDTRCHRVIRPDRETDLLELWDHINSDDDAIGATPLRYWRAKTNHQVFALKIWVENQPHGFDLTSIYLDRAGVGCTATGFGDFIISDPTREKQWDRFDLARKAVAALDHGFDQEGQRLSCSAPVLVAAVVAEPDALAKSIQAAVSRTASTWEEFRRQAGLEIPPHPLMQ